MIILRQTCHEKQIDRLEIYILGHQVNNKSDQVLDFT